MVLAAQRPRTVHRQLTGCPLHQPAEFPELTGLHACSQQRLGRVPAGRDCLQVDSCRRRGPRLGAAELPARGCRPGGPGAGRIRWSWRQLVPHTGAQDPELLCRVPPDARDAANLNSQSPPHQAVARDSFGQAAVDRAGHAGPSQPPSGDAVDESHPFIPSAHPRPRGTRTRHRPRAPELPVGHRAATSPRERQYHGGPGHTPHHSRLTRRRVDRLRKSAATPLAPVSCATSRSSRVRSAGPSESPPEP